MKKFVNNVGKIENINNLIIDSFECNLCKSMAYEPLYCLKCEMAVSCSDCYQAWKKSKGRDQCPLCRDQDHPPKPIIKLALKTRDD